MSRSDRSADDRVLAAWAPAGWGRILVLLDEGVVIHKFVFSLKAAAADIGASVSVGVDAALDGPDGSYDSSKTPKQSPFVTKVLRHGVEGLLASPRKTLIPWDRIVSAEFRGRMLFRGRLVIRTDDHRYKLKVLTNSVATGDPLAVFADRLADRYVVLNAR